MKDNIEIVLREQGKLSCKVQCHNVWASAGQRWLSQLVSLEAEDTPLENNRIRFIGLGIGGTKQKAAYASSSFLMNEYPGTNRQNVQQSIIEHVERPVRVRVGEYLQPINIIDMPDSYTVRCTTHFQPFDISYNNSTFRQIPLSDVALFANTSATDVSNNPVLGYSVFSTIYKSNTHDMTITWTIRF